MPKDRYSEEEVERILTNAIRADSSLPANSAFSADDVRRIAGELGLDSSKLEFDRSESPPEITWRLGKVQKVTYRAKLKGDPELIFERALSVIQNRYHIRSQISVRPRGREMINILPDTRSRLNVIDDDRDVTIEYFRDFSSMTLAPVLGILILIPALLALVAGITKISPMEGFLLWICLSFAAQAAASALTKRYLRQETALWAKIVAENSPN